MLYVIMDVKQLKNARDNHIKWELEHNLAPYEDWSKEKGVDPNE